MNPKISDSELEVMRILWREAKPLPYAEIRKELESKTDWKKSTIQTLVVRLRDKGAIKATESYVTLYTPLVSEAEYLENEEQSFLDKLFNGSAKNLVAALCKSGKLDENDVDELKSYFRMEGDQ